MGASVELLEEIPELGPWRERLAGLGVYAVGLVSTPSGTTTAGVYLAWADLGSHFGWVLAERAAADDARRAASRADVVHARLTAVAVVEGNTASATGGGTATGAVLIKGATASLGTTTVSDSTASRTAPVTTTTAPPAAAQAVTANPAFTG